MDSIEFKDMKEKVYVKTTKDNLWTNNPVVATLIFFTVFYIFVVMNLGLISRIFYNGSVI